MRLLTCFMVDVFRDAAWLSQKRARAYCKILLTITLLISTGLIVTSRGGVDINGQLLGTDFISFWTASSLALKGFPTSVYDMAVHHAAEIALFGTAASDYTAFFYPPVFLLICLPLALLPYLPSLVAWLVVTGFGFWRCLRAILPQSGTALAALAFPAVFLNAGHGQNGFLTAALFGGAMLALPTRPIVAGLCFGCLIYKPHLGIMIPFALLAARRWTTFLTAAATALGLMAVSAMVFGLATWRAFFTISPLAKIALEQDLIGPEKMPSTFAAVRLLHGSVAMAYALQAIVTLGVGVALVMALRRRPGGLGEGALIATGALIASPFLLDYDLTILALPLAWTMREALQGEFMPWEKSTLAAGFALPLFCRTVAGNLEVPLGPPILGAMFCIVLRRLLLRRTETSTKYGI